MMETLATLVQQSLQAALTIWTDGGWGMIGLAVCGLILFAKGAQIHFALHDTGHTKVPEKVWRQWVRNPDEGQGVIGEIIRHVMEERTLEGVSKRFEEVRANVLAPFAEDLKFMKVSVTAAPLLGLLGTVTGMLATFQALASGSGGDKTMNLVAAGISEALITTETGLVLALPGSFWHYGLSRERDRLTAFLAHMETVCTQHVYRLRKGGGAPMRVELPAGASLDEETEVGAMQTEAA